MEKKYLYEYKAAFIGKNKCEEFLLSNWPVFSLILYLKI